MPTDILEEIPFYRLIEHASYSNILEAESHQRTPLHYFFRREMKRVGKQGKVGN